MAHGPSDSRLRLAVSTLPAVVFLVGVIAYGFAEKTHGQLSKLGEHWYGSDSPLVPGYKDLRTDPKKPECDPKKAFVPPAVAPAGADGDDDLLDGLDGIEDEEEKEKPAPKPAGGGDDDDVDLDALLDDDGDGDGDGGGAKPDAGAKAAAAVANAKKAYDASIRLCEERHAKYLAVQARITPGVKRFRVVEQGVFNAQLWGFNHQKHTLILVLLICAITASSIRGHISLRPAKSKLDHRVSEGVQLLAALLLTYSAVALRQSEMAAGTRLDHPELFTYMIVGFAAMAGVHLYNMARLPADATEEGSWGRASLCIPLYTVMCLVSGAYFFSKGHWAGLGIYIGKLPSNALLYMQVGLYVWVGMLLKQTRLAGLLFDVVRPWKLPPEMLAFVAVVGAALPTAYSGASGIFVIAVGAVIYEELRKAGAPRQLALAATAMSGSMGVVLRPCLLVVIVAALNPVTTDQLYGWGFKVFLLTAVLFLVASLITRRGPITIAPVGEALPESLRRLKPIVPYVVIITVVLAFEAIALDAYVDEHYAPYILPLLLLVVLVYDRRAAKKADPEASGYRVSIGNATCETTGHIGALLMLMGLSVCLGGIIEDAEVMNLVPESFGSTWRTMGLLVVVLVIVGMTMDPYGAVILVSATLAAVATRNGIDPVHFWMVVLVAFELGYLTPPVALNHLLTRQVVGEDEAMGHDEEEEDTFWRRHERILLPIVVMATALLIVAFVPLMFGSYGQ